MPEQTALKILEIMRRHGVSAELTPNRRGVKFGGKTPISLDILTKITQEANKLASNRGLLSVYSQQPKGGHQIFVKTRRAMEKRREN